MEYTKKDISQFIIDTVDLNKKPLKFVEPNTKTVLQLIKRGYEVIVKEDSIFYVIVSPPTKNLVSKVRCKLKRR